MKLNELPFGQIFQFYFNLGSAWSYKKLSDDTIQCVSAPSTETANLRRVYNVNTLLKESHVLPELDTTYASNV